MGRCTMGKGLHVREGWSNIQLALSCTGADAVSWQLAYLRRVSYQSKMIKITDSIDN